MIYTYVKWTVIVPILTISHHSLNINSIDKKVSSLNEYKREWNYLFDHMQQLLQFLLERGICTIEEVQVW